MSLQSTNPKSRRQQQHPDPLLNDVSEVIIEQQRRGEGRPRQAVIRAPAPLVRESVRVATFTQGVPVRVPSLFGSH